MQPLTDARLLPYCISKKYSTVRGLITKKFGYDHPMLEDLIQEGAIGYQQWLTTIDLDKLPNPFNSAMKKAYWRAYDILRKESIRTCDSLGEISEMSDDTLHYYGAQKFHSDYNEHQLLNSVCEDVVTKISHLSAKDADNVKEYFGHDGANSSSLDTASKYKKRQYKALIKDCIEGSAI